jgi:tetratricopeptide (TPR) repeat protein
MLLVTIPAERQQAATEQIARMRLMPSSGDLQFQGRVRESLRHTSGNRAPRVEGLPFRIRRGTREHDPRVKVATARRNIRLSKMEMQQHGADPRLLNCLGDAFQSLDDNRRAIDFFRHALQLSERSSVDMLEAYYGVITSLDGVEGARDQQLALAVEALEIFPLDAQLLCAMGGYLQSQGRLDLALQSYRTAYQHGQVNPNVWHVAEIRDIAGVCCSLAMQLQNQHQQARQFLERAVAENATSQRLRRQLIELHVRSGSTEEALHWTQDLPPNFPNLEAFRSAVRGACLAAQGNWIAAKAHLTTAHQAGCRDPLCLRWLATALLSGGGVVAARPIVEQWLGVEPTNPEALRYQQLIQPAADDASTPSRQLRLDRAGGPPSDSTPSAAPHVGLHESQALDSTTSPRRP